MKTLKIFLIVMIFSFQIVFCQSTNLFKTADELLLKCNSLNADLFSPLNYFLGTEKLQLAKSMKNSSNEEIFPVVQEAETYLFAAVEKSQFNSENLFDVYILWDKYQVQTLEKNSKIYFFEGEKHFKKSIENGELNLPQKEIFEERDLAKSYFDKIEMISENEKVLSPLLNLKMRAEENNCKDFLPEETKIAETKFELAFTSLKEGNRDEFIRKIIATETEYEKILTASKLANEESERLFAARQVAEKADAQIFARDEWQKANMGISQIGKLFYSADNETARQMVIVNINLFYEAEETAIYEKYIGTKKQEISNLTDQNLAKKDPILVKRINLILEKADKLFSANKYSKKVEELSKIAEIEISRGREIVRIYKENNTNLVDSLILHELYPFGKSDYINAKEQNLNEQIDKKQVDNKIEQIKNEQNGIIPRNPKAELAELFQTTYQPNEIEIIDEGTQLRIRFLTLKLRSDETVLLPKNKLILDKLIKIIINYNDFDFIQLEAYADNKGGEEMNFTLTQQKLNTVVDYLLTKKIAQSVINPVNFGTKNPIASNDTLEGRAFNRRIEAVFYFQE